MGDSCLMSQDHDNQEPPLIYEAFYKYQTQAKFIPDKV